VHGDRQAGDDAWLGSTGVGGGLADAGRDVLADRGGVGHPEDRAGAVLSGHPEQARSERADEHGDLGAVDQGRRAGGDPELLAGEVHGLAPEQGGDDLYVLLGVATGRVVGQPEHALDDRSVRGPDTERHPSRGTDGGGRGGGPGCLEGRVAGVALEHRRAQLDRGGGPAGQRHDGERVAEHRARVPEAGEPVGLGLFGLPDDLLGGRPASG
jgi:hypothetical protein